MTERVIVFIDGSNFYHSVKEEFSIHDNIDFRASGFDSLIKTLTGQRLLAAVYYYNAPLDRNLNKEVYSKQQKFFDELRRLPGWNVILCRLRKNETGNYTVKGDDVHLAVDMVRLTYENVFDTAIIISGDGDFVPAIKVVQKLGKRVENAYFNVSASSYLKQVCNSSIPLESVVKEILENKK